MGIHESFRKLMFLCTMSRQQSPHTSRFDSMEYRLVVVAFVLLWIYLFVRAWSVFYVHDEIVTKWSYIIHWNPFPNQGAIDANNHFLLSLLAGFFTRLFHSDSMFVIRLASVLAFPIYFWSAYRLKPFFKQSWNFYGLLIALTTTSFLIDFFSLARGYGLALAFLVFSIQQTFVYVYSAKKRALIGALIGWILAVYASLTLLPLMLFGMLLIGFHTFRIKAYFWLIPFLVAFVPIGYFIDYTFTLKELGLLYYGGTDGFFPATVHSITRYVWYAEGLWLDVLLTFLMGFIGFLAMKTFWKTKNPVAPKLLFALFLFAGLASIFIQHWFLDVNYPEDRAALFLVVVFFGALFFALDELEKWTWPSRICVLSSMALFVLNLNFTHTHMWISERMDEAIVRKIPTQVEGTPPTTAGRWNMENELNRELNLPFRVFQESGAKHDTLVDYRIERSENHREFSKQYTREHLDPISGLALYKRKKFLKRRKTDEVDYSIISEVEFQNIHVTKLDGPMVLRCSGKLEDMTQLKEIFIVFSSEDTLTKKLYTYELIPMIRNKQLNDRGELTFDFSYALNALDGANAYAAYIWNQNKEALQGKIKLEVYEIVE